MQQEGDNQEVKQLSQLEPETILTHNQAVSTSNEPTIRIINTTSLYTNHSLLSNNQTQILKNSISLQSHNSNRTNAARASISNVSSNINNLLSPTTHPSTHSYHTHRRESFLYKSDGEFDSIPTKLALNTRHLEQ